MRVRKFLSIGVCVFLLSGCGDASDAPAQEAALLPLERTVWRAENIAGQAALPDVAVTLELNGLGRVGGESGCNRYIGQYALPEKGKIKFPVDLASTRRACLDPKRAEQERLYLSVMGRVSGYAIGADGRLILSTEDGQKIAYVAVPEKTEPAP